MASREFISFEAVRKTYDGNHFVVHGLDLAVRQGEFLTLLGPSGCGKTTTLMMLAGFESPTDGAIYLDGERIDRVPAHKRNIGVVFQNYALFPHMTVAQNIAFPLRMRGARGACLRDKVASAMEMVRLQGFAHRKPAQLSGGQQQRVALARALVFEPTLILMDEPLGALDKQLREHMQLEIKQLHARLGISIVYVTHDQAEALTMSDRVAVLKDGVLQQLAPPSVLYEEPANTFVAQFIGENNTLTGTVCEIDATHCTIRTADGTAVQARATAGVVKGQNVSLSLRPEKVVLGTTPTDGFNTVAAKVSSTTYYGDHLRLQVRTCGQDDFLIKTPDIGLAETMRPGTAITIGWKREDCRALPLH